MKIQENETLEIIEVYERERVPEFIQKGEPRYYEWKKIQMRVFIDGCGR